MGYRDYLTADREEAMELQEREDAFWNEYMPDWEERLRENDFATGYDVMEELFEIGML